MRRRAKVDGNHADMVAALRARGYLVLSLASLGQGVPDLLTCDASGVLRLVEVKATYGQLTPDQLGFIGNGWPVTVARTVEDVCG